MQETMAKENKQRYHDIIYNKMSWNTENCNIINNTWYDTIECSKPCENELWYNKTKWNKI